MIEKETNMKSIKDKRAKQFKFKHNENRARTNKYVKFVILIFATVKHK
jgi:hypothetical protein